MPVLPDAALLLSVEARLREWLGDEVDPNTKESKKIGIQPDGQPPPVAGRVYYAVHDGGARGTSPSAQYVQHRQSVLVTVTRRAGVSPPDRTGRSLLVAEGAGLLDLAAGLLRPGRMHGSYAVIGEANGLLAVPTGYGWVEPLLYRGRTPVQERGPAWLWADGDQDAAAALSVTMTFAEALYEAPVL